MFAEIIPLQRMPRDKKTYTYAVPSEIEGTICVGQIVEITIRGRTLNGLVAELHNNKPNYNKIVSVTRALEEKPSWNKAQVKSLFRCANYYFSSPSSLAFHFIPSIPKRIIEVKKKKLDLLALSSFNVSQTAVKQINQLVKQLPVKETVIKFQHHGERFYLYRKLCQEVDGQILILTPTHRDAEEIYSFLMPNFAKDLYLWKASQGKNERLNAWNTIKSGKKIIIGTRSAIFVPAANLSCIVIDQSERSEHKQWDASPYYDARYCAGVLAEEFNVPFLKVSHWPRALLKNESNFIRFKSTSPPLRIVHHTSSKELLSNLVLEDIKDVLKNNKSVILITTHKMGARTVRCLDCQKQWRCPNCQLNLYETEEEYTCAVCKYSEAKVVNCPQCKGSKINSFGVGVDGLKNYLKAKIANPIYKITSSQNLAEAEIMIDNPSVLICTPLAWWNFVAKFKLTLGMVLFFQPEGILFMPDYRASQRFFQLINWYSLRAKDYYGLTLAMQSSLKQDNPLLKNLLEDDFENLLEQELKQRQQLKKPPYYDLIRLAINSSKIEPSDALDSLFDHLKDTNGVLQVTGPYKRFISQKDWQLNWLISVEANKQINLDKTLGSFYNNFIIDRNPDKL